MGAPIVAGFDAFGWDGAGVERQIASDTAGGDLVDDALLNLSDFLDCHNDCD